MQARFQPRQTNHMVWWVCTYSKMENSHHQPSTTLMASTVLIFLPDIALTYLVLRLVHPVVIVLLLLASVCYMKVSVRLSVRLVLVGRVEFSLALEDASALVGESGHAKPAKSPGQSCRFLLTKGRTPSAASHPDPGQRKFKTQ